MMVWIYVDPSKQVGDKDRRRASGFSYRPAFSARPTFPGSRPADFFR